MTDRDDEHWNPYRIPEFGAADQASGEPTPYAGREPRTEGQDAGWADGEGQYVFGGDDYWSGEPHQEPHHEPHPAPAPPPPPAHRQPPAPVPAPPPAPAQPQAAAPPRRGLVLGLSLGAVGLVGAVVAGALLLPGLLSPAPNPGPTITDGEVDWSTSVPPDPASDAPSTTTFAGTWNGTTESGTGGPPVEFVATLADDGTTLSGTIDYPAFGCRSTLTQRSRDANRIVLDERLDSGPCGSDDTSIELQVPVGGVGDTVHFTVGTRSGTLTRQ